MFVTPLALVVAALPALLDPNQSVWADADVQLMIGVILASLFILWLGRTRFRLLTPVLAVGVAFLGVFFTLLTDDISQDLYSFYYFIVPVSLTAVFFSTQSAIILALLSGLSILISPLLITDLRMLDVVAGPFSFLIVSTVIIIYFNHYRHQFDVERQEKLQLHVEQLRAIYHLSHAVGRVASVTEIYDLAMSGLLHTLPIDRTAILLFDDDGIMQFVAWRGLSEKYRQKLAGHSPWTQGTPDPKPLVIHTIHDPRVAAYQEALTAEGIQALAFVPLQLNGRLLGKFMIYCNKPHVFTEIEMELAQTIASHVALALGRQQDIDRLRKSEERYRLIIENSSDLIVRVDTNGRFLFVSPSYCQLFGKKETDLLGKSFLPLVHPDDRLETEAAMTRLNEPPHTTYVEQRALTIRGWRWLAWLDQAIVDDNNIVTGVIGIGRDITTQKEAETERQLYAQRLEILHTIDKAILAANSPERIAEDTITSICSLLNCQQGAIITFDWEQEEAILLAILVDFNHDSQRNNRKPISSLQLPDTLVSGEIYTNNQLTKAGKGSLIENYLQENGICSLLVAPLVSNNGLIGALYLAASQMDYFNEWHIAVADELANTLAVAISQANLAGQVKAYTTELEQRVAQRTEALMIANEQLSALDKLKTKFIADVSHELRTPIANLSLYTDLLHASSDESKQAQYMQVLKQQTSRLRQLVEEIFQIARLDALSLSQMAWEPIVAETLVQQVAARLQLLAEEQGTKIQVEVNTAVSTFSGDPNLIFLLFSALLKNAIQHTPNGTVKLQMGIAKSELFLAVIDNGTGISEEDMPHLFERFYRGTHVGQSTQPGAGLGLSLAKRIVELHNGRITVDSQVGSGSRFTVYLPLSAAIAADLH